MNKKLCIAEEFSGILSDLAKQKMTIIKLSNLNENL